jgi:hypothetical protein
MMSVVGDLKVSLSQPIALTNVVSEQLTYVVQIKVGNKTCHF